jgi:hypothetical protein
LEKVWELRAEAETGDRGCFNMGTLVALLRGLMTPMKLTDTELDIVMRAAQPLAVNDRDPFLQAVASRLAGLSERGDGIRDRAALWTRKAIADVELERVVEALRQGLSIRDAANELGMTKSKVERLRAKAKERGLLA